MKKKKEKMMHLRIDNEMFQRLKDIGDGTGVSVSEIARQAIVDRLETPDLKERLTAIEQKLNIQKPPPPKHHHKRITYEPPTERPLPELTPDETRWLQKRTLPLDSRQEIRVTVYQNTLEAGEREIINSIRKKRNLNVTWQT